MTVWNNLAKEGFCKIFFSERFLNRKKKQHKKHLTVLPCSKTQIEPTKEDTLLAIWEAPGITGI